MLLSSSSIVTAVFAISAAFAARTDPASTAQINIVYDIRHRAHGTAGWVMQDSSLSITDPNNYCMDAFGAKLVPPSRYHCDGEFGSSMDNCGHPGLDSVTFAANVTIDDHVVQSCRFVSATEELRSSYDVIPNDNGTFTLSRSKGTYIPPSMEGFDENHVCLDALATSVDLKNGDIKCDGYNQMIPLITNCHPVIKKGMLTFIGAKTIDIENGKRRTVTTCKPYWSNN